MDEKSIKNTKEDHTTPSNSQTKSGKVQKKPRKRIKGQKDIRALIKSKKNELISYSKDFKAICKQSGIDVDPEQLQLAIALSKSLQDSNQLNISGTDNEKTLTAKQRKGKIRSTLQEYGFKVPDVKTNTNKVKRYRKQYRLLLAPDTEKQQIIADKYAQILLTNVSICFKSDESLIAFKETNSCLYNLTTNVPYECLKNDEIFYVNNLVEKHLTDTHNMLKDWSEIPGRPVSPKLEPSDVTFKDVECTQEELNIILSGGTEKAQDIVKTKYKYNKQFTKEENNSANKLDCGSLVSEIETEHQKLSQIKIKMDGDGIIDNTTNNKETYNKTNATNRSYSPDIFDDEVTIIIDSPQVTHKETPERTLVREQNNFMDLTECVGLANHNKTNFIHNSNLSQGNKTRMNPNDVMDLTECVPAFSNRIHDNKGNDEEKENVPNIFKQNSQPETMDLTQCHNLNNSNDKLSIEHTSNCDAEDSIIIIEEEDNKCPSNLVKTTLQNSKEVINSKNLNDTVINVEKSFENNDITTGNSNSEYDDHLYRLSNESSKDIYTSNNILNKNDSTSNLIGSNLLKSNMVLDAMDLTQSSNSEESLSLTDECRNSAVDAVIDLSQEYDDHNENNHTVKELIDNEVNSSKYSNDSYNISHIVMIDSKNSKKFGSPIKDFPKRSSNSDSDTENKDNLTKKHNSRDVMNLTQSSNFENVEIIHETSTANKSLEDTIILNDDEYNLNTVYNNNHRSDVHIIDTENSDNDREFDNVLENSNARHGQIVTKLHDTNEFITSKSLYNVNSSIFENDPDIQNLQFDTIQQNNIEHRDNPKKTLYDDQTVVDTNNDVLFDNMLENVSKSKESLHLSKSYADENDGNVDFKNDTFRNNSDRLSCEIDLTQQDNFSNDKISTPDTNNDYAERKNDTSTDNEELKDSNHTKNSNLIILDPLYDNTSIKNVKSGSGDDVSNSSQISEVFEISDNEFNYSIHQNKHETVRLDRTRFDIGGISAVDEILNRSSISSKLRCSCGPDSELNANENKDDNCLPEVTLKRDDVLREDIMRSDVNYEKVATPSKCRPEGVLSAITPKHNDYIIKTDQVTPMPYYDKMSSPERNQELDKYGIKPLKRKRAIQILTHIYNQTHPVMELMSQSEDCPSPLKIRKMNDPTTFPRRAISTQIDAIMTNMKDSTNIEPFQLTNSSQKSCEDICKKAQKSPKKSPESLKDSNKENLYEETKYLPDIRNIECCPEDWIFQTREKSKVQSCRVPLHIAFHNYISCRQALREALLKYEPINIDDIHKGLVDVGYRYNPKDLLKFMDKKCITVKTADNARSNRK